MKSGWSCTRMTWREKRGEGEKQLMIQSTPHHLSMRGRGPGSLLFTDAVTSDRRSRMNHGGYGVILSDQTQPHAAEIIRHHFTAQMDSDPKQTKATQGMGYPSLAESVTWNKPDRAALQLLNMKHWITAEICTFITHLLLDLKSTVVVYMVSLSNKLWT